MAKKLIIALSGAQCILTGSLAEGVNVANAYSALSAKKKKGNKPKVSNKFKKPLKGKATKKKYPTKKKTNTKKKVISSKLPDWWTAKTDASKKKYVEQHPNSKFVKKIAAKSPSLKKVLDKAIHDESNLEKDPEKVNKQTKDMVEKSKLPEPEKKLDEVAVKKHEVVPAGGPSEKEKQAEQQEEQKTEQKKFKSIFHRAYAKARMKISHALQKDKIGMHCTGKFLAGHVLNDKEHQHMINWAGKAAKLVVSAAVGVALFTPLAGLAPELGKQFLALMAPGGAGVSESASKKRKFTPPGNPAKFDPTHFTDMFQQWLMKQDIPSLIEKLKKSEV